MNQDRILLELDLLGKELCRKLIFMLIMESWKNEEALFCLSS